MTLAEVMDGARLVRTDKERNLFLVWFGRASTYVHVYDINGGEPSSWAVELNDMRGTVEEQIEDSMCWHIKFGEYPC